MVPELLDLGNNPANTKKQTVMILEMGNDQIDSRHL